MSIRRLAPDGYALAGVALISVLIGLVRPRYAVPELSMVHLVLVLWLGARCGILPAAIAGVAACGGDAKCRTGALASVRRCVHEDAMSCVVYALATPPSRSERLALRGIRRRNERFLAPISGETVRFSAKCRLNNYATSCV